MSWVQKNNSHLSDSARTIVCSIKDHRRGMPMPDFDTIGIVYAIFFMLKGHQPEPGIYVGITHRSVTARFEEHIRQARDYRTGLRILDGDAVKLYAKMAALGVDNCYIIPIQKIEGVEPRHHPDFYAAAKRYERDWIRILNSREDGFNSYIPGGKHTTFSSYLGDYHGDVSSLWHPVRNLYRGNRGHEGGFQFHYRDYVRRFQSLHARRGLTGPESQAEVISHMHRQNLERMVAVASLHSIQGIAPEDQGILVETLISRLDARAQNRDRRGKKATKLFVPFFNSIFLDDLPLQHILCN